MRSTLTRVATLAGFAATALTAAAVAQAATPQVHDDAAVIARHRAAGQLGQANVYVNEALIARHRAAGRLGQPKVSVNPADVARHRALARRPRHVAPPVAQAAGSFPWRRTTLAFAVVLGTILAPVGLLRVRRVRIGSAS